MGCRQPGCLNLRPTGGWEVRIVRCATSFAGKKCRKPGVGVSKAWQSRRDGCLGPEEAAKRLLFGWGLGQLDPTLLALILNIKYCGPFVSLFLTNLRTGLFRGLPRGRAGQPLPPSHRPSFSTGPQARSKNQTRHPLFKSSPMTLSPFENYATRCRVALPARAEWGSLILV